MTSAEARICWTYGAALTLFVAHSIDSTRFAEWGLFRMSATTYVLAYVPITAIALYGLVALALGLRNGYQLALLLGLVDCAAILVHGPAILAGTGFREPLSVALIAGMLLAGAALVVLALAHLLGVRTQPVSA